MYNKEEAMTIHDLIQNNTFLIKPHSKADSFFVRLRCVIFFLKFLR